MLIRITLRLIIASIASVILTATIIALKNFHLELWKSWRLRKNLENQVNHGTLTDNLQFSSDGNDEGDSRSGSLEGDVSDATMLPLLPDIEGISSSGNHYDYDAHTGHSPMPQSTAGFL